MDFRKTHFLILFSALCLVAPACGSGGGGGGEGSAFENDTPGGTGSQTTSDHAPVVTSVFEQLFRGFDAFVEVDCECEAGEHFQECIDEYTMDGTQESEVLSCVHESAASYDVTPPPGALEFMQCIGDAYSDATACIHSVRSTFGDVCSEDATIALEECWAIVMDAEEYCEEQLYATDPSGEADDWVDGIIARIEDDGCLDSVPIW